MKIHLIAGARPNFMKLAPLYHALRKETLADAKIIHTGQHYDVNMSDGFFKDLLLPEPHVNLGVGSGSHAEQTGKIMIAYEKLCLEERPDLTIVMGDVNSTVACALVAAKLGIKVAHLEAGLRSFDKTMPEEINRLVTDALSDILWTPSPEADENLKREGVSPDKIHRVGNIMIDALEMLRPKIELAKHYISLNLKKDHYGLITLHRPSNVDDEKKLAEICDVLKDLSREIPLVFPLHPRTKKKLTENNLLKELKDLKSLHCLEPLPYIQFMSLLFNARFVLTDSGGVQEETTYLGISCLTLRENTERPVTVTEGTNKLVKVNHVKESIVKILRGEWPQGRVPDLWDGQTAERIIAHLREISFRI